MIVDHPRQRGRSNYKHSCFSSAGDKKPEYNMSYTDKKNVFWSTWKDTVHTRLIENSRALSTRKGNSVSSSQSFLDGIYLLKPKCN